MNERAEDDLWKAYHEAGHAVAARHHGGEIQLISILPNELYQGICLFSANRLFQEYGHNPTINKITTHIVISLAGPAAQMRFAPGSCDQDQFRLDRESVEAQMIKLSRVKDATIWGLNHYEELAESLVCADENWAAIEELANVVARRKRLTGTEATRIIDRVWEEYFQ